MIELPNKIIFLIHDVHGNQGKITGQVVIALLHHETIMAALKIQIDKFPIKYEQTMRSELAFKLYAKLLF